MKPRLVARFGHPGRRYGHDRHGGHGGHRRQRQGT